MNLRHVALACSSQENADRFFGDLLGLGKSEPKSKTLPASLSRAIFGIYYDLEVVNYSNASHRVRFEIFIDPHVQSRPGSAEHVCLEVDDLAAFLQRCRDLNVTVIRVPKGSSVLTFIRDFDGNLYEIK